MLVRERTWEKARCDRLSKRFFGIEDTSEGLGTLEYRCEPGDPSV
jgi:hypothetical protein